MLVKSQYHIPSQLTPEMSLEEKEQFAIQEMKQDIANKIISLLPIHRISGVGGVMVADEVTYSSSVVIFTPPELARVRELVTQLQKNSSEEVRFLADQLRLFF